VLQVARVRGEVDEHLLVGLGVAEVVALMPRWYFTSPTQGGPPGRLAAEDDSPFSGCWNSPKILE
jgi:hypothetical protein